MGIGASFYSEPDVIQKCTDALVQNGYAIINNVVGDKDGMYNRSPICHSLKVSKGDRNYWAKIYRFSNSYMCEKYASDLFKSRLEILNPVNSVNNKDKTLKAKVDKIEKDIPVAILKEMTKFAYNLNEMKNIDNIIPIKEVILTEHQLIIIMKYMKFPSLFDILSEDEYQFGFPNDQNETIVQVVRTLLETVSSLHSQNILHQNLSSKNIFLDIKGNRVFISPIGIYMNYASMTLIGGDSSPLNNMKYHEYNDIRDGNQQYDKLCDIFSIGMIIGDILMGLSDNDDFEMHGSYREQYVVDKLSPFKYNKYSLLLMSCIYKDRCQRSQCNELINLFYEMNEVHLPGPENFHIFLDIFTKKYPDSNQVVGTLYNLSHASKIDADFTDIVFENRDDEFFVDFSNLVASIPSLVLVDITNCHMKARQLCLTSQYVANLETINSLNYSGNFISDELMELFLNNKNNLFTLQILNLRNATIDNSLPDHILTSRNSITDVGLEKLGETINSCPYLTTLNISGHLFGVSGIDKFINKIESPTSITYLDIGSNNSINSDCVKLIFRSDKFPKLEKLYLSNTSVQYDAIEFIKQIHVNYEELTEIYVSNTPITSNSNLKSERITLSSHVCDIIYS